MGNKVPGMGRRNIGALQNNQIKDVEFVKLVMNLNLEIRKLGREGKPKTVEQLEERVDRYLEICASYGLAPTVERSCYFYRLR